jgi:hypothetical protein
LIGIAQVKICLIVLISMMVRQKWVLAMLFVALSVAFALYCLMISADRFGDYGDDGIYVSAAKALATGQGYRIISLPQGAPQTQIPPLYPFLLSLIWRAYPNFPSNTVWMMFAFGHRHGDLPGLSYGYL